MFREHREQFYDSHNRKFSGRIVNISKYEFATVWTGEVIDDLSLVKSREHTWRDGQYNRSLVVTNPSDGRKKPRFSMTFCLIRNSVMRVFFL